MKAKSLSLAIILCTFQNEKTIKDVIHSLDIATKQFLKRKIFLIDDCSYDLTTNYALSHLEESGIEFQLVSKEKNLGISNSRNIGIKLSSNYDLITFVDGDDLLFKDAWIHFAEYDSKKVSDINLFSFNRLQTDNKLVFKSMRSIYLNGGDLIYESLMPYLKRPNRDFIFTFCWGRVYRRKVLESIFFDEKLDNFEDLAFNLDLLPHIKSINSTQKVGYIYIENNPGYSLSINLAKSITQVLENNLSSLNRVNNLIKSAKISNVKKTTLFNTLNHTKYAYISIIMSRETPLRIKSLRDFINLSREYKFFCIRHNIISLAKAYDNKIGKGPILPLICNKNGFFFLAILLWLIKDIAKNKFTTKN